MLHQDTLHYSFFPIQHQSLIDMYQAQKNAFWFPGEIDFSSGETLESTLNPSEQAFVKKLLALFNQMDGIVCENLQEQFMGVMSEMYKEAGAFLRIQMAIETIHAETYGLLAKKYITDETERYRLYDSIHYMDSIKQLANWAETWMTDDVPLLERVIAFACVEGIFFSPSFAGIQWVTRQNKLQPISESNELIRRDEALHVQFAHTFYHTVVNDSNRPETAVPFDRLCTIVKSATEVQQAFVRDALQVDMIGLSSEDMVTYVECCADGIAEGFCGQKVYKSVNPLTWMTKISLQTQTNFFEKRNLTYNRVTDYSEDQWDETDDF